MMRKRLSPRGRRGIVLVLVAVCLVLLLGAVAVSVDGGVALAERRHARAAADAAALAAAADLFENYPANNGRDPNGSARASARAVAAANGYANDGTTTTVTIRISPENYLGGPRAGQQLPPGHAEVAVQFNQRRGFSAVFGDDDLPIHARAVARGQLIALPAIVALDLSAPAALAVLNGNGDVTVSTGSVVVNSSSPLAAVNGTVANLIAPQFEVAGGTFTPAPGRFVGNVRTGTRPQPDPLRHQPAPDPAGLPPRTLPQPDNGVYRLTPGRYSGLSFTGSDSAQLAPGVYYVEHGFSFQSSGTLTGNGVVIYNASRNPNEGIRLGGPGAVTLSPPATGPYQGVTFFQDRESTAPLTITHFAGNGDYNITGALYAANAAVRVTRKPGDVTLGSQFVSRTLLLTGSGQLNVPGSGARRRVFGLVE